MGQLKADDSGPLYPEQGGICERETRLNEGPDGDFGRKN